eukprot:GHVR01167116.1.p1 GENE.GHVR01167116.1~~GHVR01167116.1.p1  ORF type:complete len:460 (-),score=93.55 GHVR01167116.1:276-1655(-)
MKFALYAGASTGAECEDRWAKNDMISRRSPHQVGKNIAAGINNDRIAFSDKHLSMFPQDLLYGYYSLAKAGKALDISIIEATAITSDGLIVPGAAVGATPEFLQASDKIIIELNTALPDLTGLHDILMERTPPNRVPLFINRAGDRVGEVGARVDPERVIGVVESTKPDNTPPTTAVDEESKMIAQHIVEFLSREIKAGRLPSPLPPMQSGIGNIANAVIEGLAEGPFNNLQVYTEVIQDSFLKWFEMDKLDFASATSIRFSPEMFAQFYKESNFKNYKQKIILRNQVISNSPEVIRRMGVVAMNTPVEIDIYGHANSTCVQGSRMLNGVGGSGDFLRNARLSIMHTPSARGLKGDPTAISCVVPFCSHVDHTEHDTDIFVTEQGLADLRGKCPRERALEVINKCAHPDYRPLLKEYYELSHKACLSSGSTHEPHMLKNAFKLHTNLQEKGTMKIASWD